jgi:hypothetical protein
VSAAGPAVVPGTSTTPTTPGSNPVVPAITPAQGPTPPSTGMVGPASSPRSRSLSRSSRASPPVAARFGKQATTDTRTGGGTAPPPVRLFSNTRPRTARRSTMSSRRSPGLYT